MTDQDHESKMKAANLRIAEAQAQEAEFRAAEAKARARKTEAIADDIVNALKNGRRPNSWNGDR